MTPRPSVLLFLLAAAGPLAAQEPWVDPRLRLLETVPAAALLEPGDRPRALPEGRPGMVPSGGALPLRRGPGGRIIVPLLVEVRNAAALSELRALGAEVGVVVGRIATVRAPVDAIPRITTLRSLVRIEAARPFRLHNDSAGPVSRVDEVRHREGVTFRGTVGRGVAIGIMDTGIDPYHRDFHDDDGTPRIAALWDQATGRFCDPASILAGTCTSGDPVGHGTHVAGIAAGDGSYVGTDSAWLGVFAGVAPEASILSVRFSFLDDADLVDGVAWMFGKADSLGVPAVVNISLGTHVGPHDGTSLLEQALDDLTGPGRIIVASAGNEGNARNTSPQLTRVRVHSRATVEPGTPAVLTFRLTPYTPWPGGCNDFALLDLWYGADQAVTFEVTRPDGSGLTTTTGADAASDGPGGRILILAPAAPSPGNGDRNAMIELSDCAGSAPPATGEWTLRLTTADAATEPLDLWIAASSLGSTGFALGEQGFDDAFAVGLPATARQVIAVGAYASRVCWPTRTSPSRCLQDVFGFSQPVGDIAFFSSAGPSRDGRLKPEIAAPGMLLMSARSSQTGGSGQLLGPTSRHRVEMGTSMSSPHVAGAVALLLQHEPTLTPDSVRAILAATAAADAFTGADYSSPATGLPNNLWGHGKLDARAALEVLVDPAQPAEVWVSIRSDTLPVGALLPLRALVINAFGDSIGPAAVASDDPAVAAIEAGGIRALALGTTTVRATGDGLEATVFLEVVPPATLVLEASPLPPPGSPASRAGTRLALLDLRLVADGFEGILVDSLGFSVRGRDPGARLILVQDLDDDGAILASEPVLADTLIALDGDTTLVMTPALVVGAHDTLNLIAALELSGAVPHGTGFQLVLLPELTSSVGLRSGALDQRTDPATAVASATTGTSVLLADEVFTLSENPVRSEAARLVLSFVERPTIAAVYTLGGARVVDLIPRLDAGGLRVEWDLATERGGAVAPGVYFLVVRVAGRLIREKLIIARAYGGEDE